MHNKVAKQTTINKKHIGREIEELELQYETYIMTDQRRFGKAVECLAEQFQPDSIKCRQDEQSRIQNFIENGIESKGCKETLYVSGWPGLGKTLCVKEVWSKLKEKYRNRHKFIYINAMIIQNKKDIFKLIFYSMTKLTKSTDSALYILDDLFERGHAKGLETHMNDYPDSACNIMIIDQIDQLATKQFQILYTIFEWTQKKKSKLVMIAISNTIDFPQTLTEKISSRVGNQRLIFKPYTNDQLLTIVKQRVEATQVFDQQSIHYICKKIVSSTSDIRKCLQILREAITEYQEQQHRFKGRLEKVPLKMLVKVHESSFNNIFVDNFPKFPVVYKKVLYVLANYFRYEISPCSESQFEAMCSRISTKPMFLIPVLRDLQDMGLIQLKFMQKKTDTRIDQRFLNRKHVKQTYINLKITVDDIFFVFNRQQHGPNPFDQVK